MSNRYTCPSIEWPKILYLDEKIQRTKQKNKEDLKASLESEASLDL